MSIASICFWSQNVVLQSPVSEISHLLLCCDVVCSTAILIALVFMLV